MRHDVSDEPASFFGGDAVYISTTADSSETSVCAVYINASAVDPITLYIVFPLFPQPSSGTH